MSWNDPLGYKIKENAFELHDGICNLHTPLGYMTPLGSMNMRRFLPELAASGGRGTQTELNPNKAHPEP